MAAISNNKKELIIRILIVFAGFLLNGQVFGHNYATSFLYSKLLQLNPDKEMHISLIGSITFGLVFFSGIFMVIFMKWIPERWIFFIGLTLFSSAPLVSAFVSDLRMWYISYSVPRGLGGSILYLMSYSTATKAFPNHVCSASTIISQGASVFSIIIPIMVDTLLSRYGLFKFLIIDGSYMLLLIIFAPLYESKLNPPTSVILTTSCNECKEIQTQLISDNKSNIQFSNGVHKGTLTGRSSNRKTKWFNVFKRRNFIIFLTVSVLFYSFGNIPYVHSDNYLTKLSANPIDNSVYAMAVLGASSIISKCVAAVLVDVCHVSVILLLQIALSCFGIGLTTFGLLAYICQHHHIYTITLYFGGVFLGIGEGCVWSLIYTSCYTCAYPYKSSYIFCIYSFIISIPCAIGAPFASFVYTHIGSYPIAYFIGGTAYLTAANILWLINLTRHQKLSSREEKIIEIEVLPNGWQTDS